MRPVGKLRIFLRREAFFDDVVQIYLRYVDYERKQVVIVEPVTFKILAEGEDVTSHRPSFQMTTDEAQRLMDELWHVGLRPSEGTGSAGSLAATERHLEDLRRLVFRDKYQPTPK